MHHVHSKRSVKAKRTARNSIQLRNDQKTGKGSIETSKRTILAHDAAIKYRFVPTTKNGIMYHQKDVLR